MSSRSEGASAGRQNEERRRTGSGGGTNAGTGRRIAGAALGGALVLLGLRRRSAVGTAATLVGGWLVYRGVGGRGGLARASEVAAKGGGRGGSGAREGKSASVDRSVTVRKPADELYDLWTDPESLARIMGHFAEVTPAGEDRQHWEVRSPTRRSASWDSEIVEERPGELLRWESLPGADVPNEGAVRFRDAPDDRGTEVTLSVRFEPPGGLFGRTAAERLGIVPEALARKALYRFKSLAEAGEIPTLAHNPSARGEGDLV